MNTYPRSLVLGAGFLIAALSSAHATDFTAAVAGQWDAAGTWTSTPDGSPAGLDNVVGTSFTGNVTVTGAQAANNFTIDSGSGSFALTVLGGGASGALTIGGTLTKSGGGDLTFRTSSSTLALSVGSISLTSGNLLLGTGTSANRQLSSLAVTGGTTVGTGTTLSLFVGTGSTTATFGALAVNGTGAVNIRQGSATVANTSGTLQVASLTGTGTVRVTSVASTGSTGTLKIESTADASFSGVLADGSSGALSVTKSGNFTQTLSGALNTYTGGTTVTEGTLATAATGAFGAGNVSVAAGASLTLGNSASIGDLTTLTFASTSNIALDFTGSETVGAVYNSITSTFLTAGTHDATSLNSFFGGISAFSGTGSITVSAIPEPSTYAALVGAMVLGSVALRRRRHAN